MTRKIDKWVNYAGEVCVSKNNDKGRYIKVMKDFEVMAGNSILYIPYKQHLEDRLQKGFITKEEMEKKLERNWVKGVISIPPQEEKPDVKQFPDKGAWINDALEVRLKNDNTIYIMVRKDFAVRKDSTVRLINAIDNVNSLHASGRISDEMKDRMVRGITMKDENGNIIPNRYWLQFKGSIPPQE